MAQIAGKIITGLYSIVPNFDFGVFTDEYWYINFTSRFTNSYNDIDSGDIANDATNLDFGSF